MHIEVKGPDGKDAEWILTTGSANVMATLGVGANGPNSVKLATW
jgi:hypothetical protein